MLRFFDDLAGAIEDGLKFLIRCAAYFLAGMLLVGTLFYLITWVFTAIQ